MIKSNSFRTNASFEEDVPTFPDYRKRAIKGANIGGGDLVVFESIVYTCREINGKIVIFGQLICDDDISSDSKNRFLKKCAMTMNYATYNPNGKYEESDGTTIILQDVIGEIEIPAFMKTKNSPENENTGKSTT